MTKFVTKSIEAIRIVAILNLSGRNANICLLEINKSIRKKYFFGRYVLQRKCRSYLARIHLTLDSQTITAGLGTSTAWKNTRCSQ